MQAHIPCWVTVTTESARSLYPPDPRLKVWVGQLTPELVQPLLRSQGIRAILDASHPFAVEISKLAIATATQLQIPYLRYERPLVESQSPDADNSSQSQWVESFEALFGSGILANERVLLTVGYKALSLFRSWQTQATLFARILPSVIALESSLAAGFTPDRLIALRPPISAELERALWQQWQISMVVTKASGAPGGEDVKRQVAAELGVKLVAIARPVVTYPQQTSRVEEAIAFCTRQSLEF